MQKLKHQEPVHLCILFSLVWILSHADSSYMVVVGVIWSSFRILVHQPGNSSVFVVFLKTAQPSFNSITKSQVELEQWFFDFKDLAAGLVVDSGPSLSNSQPWIYIRNRLKGFFLQTLKPHIPRESGLGFSLGIGILESFLSNCNVQPILIITAFSIPSSHNRLRSSLSHACMSLLWLWLSSSLLLVFLAASASITIY